MLQEESSAYPGGYDNGLATNTRLTPPRPLYQEVVKGGQGAGGFAGEKNTNCSHCPLSKHQHYLFWQVLINDESLQNESPESNPSAYYDRGPAHAYQLPVRIANRNPDSTDKPQINSNLPSSSYDALAEERLPMRLRGIKAAYGRALGTAGKLCLDKHASTVGGHLDSVAQAWEHLTKAAEV